MFNRREAKMKARQLIRPENSSAQKAGVVTALLLFALFMLSGRLSVIVAEWMGEVYRFLGLTVGCNLQKLSPIEKKNVYGYLPEQKSKIQLVFY